MPDVRLITGDCVEQMALLDAESIDAVVCDPPYELGFMGKSWDAAGVSFRPETWAAALRVLKPGGHLLAFGGTRTYHRIAVAIEDGGFEIRDTIAWMYGSGFPKSMDVSKAIDKAAGAERTVVTGVKAGHEDFVDRTDAHASGGRSDGWNRPWRDDDEAVARSHMTMAPATEDAARWDGWGTALKPAFEPIVVARKPLAGTVAANVLKHGTGALNINGCRVAFASDEDEDESKAKNRHADFGSAQGGNEVYGDFSMVERRNYDPPGRWPANVILDEEAGSILDNQTGEVGNAWKKNYGKGYADEGRQYDGGTFGGGGYLGGSTYTDSGGASRFFYCAKTSSAERNAGLEEFDELPSLKIDPTSSMARDGRRGSGVSANNHPTVKPIDLMRWLVRLVTPGGGAVLDPFLGSGTTGIAAALEGCSFVGIEREVPYMAIAEARIAFWVEHGEDGLRICAERDGSLKERAAHADAGQMELLA